MYPAIGRLPSQTKGWFLVPVPSKRVCLVVLWKGAVRTGQAYVQISGVADGLLRFRRDVGFLNRIGIYWLFAVGQLAVDQGCPRRRRCIRCRCAILGGSANVTALFFPSATLFGKELWAGRGRRFRGRFGCCGLLECVRFLS